MKLTLIQDLGYLYPKPTSKQKTKYGIYRCICGKEFKTAQRSVARNLTTSCGCVHKSIMTKHGMSETRLYKIWDSMIQRCTNKNRTSNKEYIKKRISICDGWMNFIAFKDWSINNGYKENLSIDRINNDGNYEPSNCRWTTRQIQSRNTRQIQSNNTSGYRGVGLVKRSGKYRSRIVVNSKEITLGYFKTAIEGAIAYNNYVIENNLEHTLNKIIYPS